MFSSLVGAAQGSEIVRLTEKNLSLLPGGKEVDGMAGDWLMRNDWVVAVIGAAYSDREANQMVSSIQGAVIDYTSRRVNNDQLVVYYPQGARVDIPSADTIIVLRDKGTSVQLQAIRYPTAAEPYGSATTYTLNDGEGFLRVMTTYENKTGKTVAVRLYDQLRCDNRVDDAAPQGESRLAYLQNDWYHAAYGVATTDRELYTEGRVGRKNLIKLGYEILYAEDSVQLNPGQKLTISRVLLTGTDVADLQKQYMTLSGEKNPSLAINLKTTTGQAVDGAFVTVRDAQNAVLSSAITDATGQGRLYLPVGSHQVEASKPGHDTLRREITIPSDKAFALVMQPPTKVLMRVESADGKMLPVKVEFRGAQGTKNPMLGPETRTEGAFNLYYSHTPHFEVPLPPGTYRVIVSHGPEYQAEVREVTLSRGEAKPLTIQIKRLFTTPNWILADLHNHSTGSGDSNVGREDRVINLAASGIEFAPATEHNRISSYTEVIRAAGLQPYIASAAGIELSGRPGPGDINHQIAFPLRPKPGRGYGAPKTDADPRVQMSRLYHYDQDRFKLMQQNHPNIGWLYFDKNQDGEIDQGFGTESMTDVMEIRETMADLPGAVNGGDTDTRSFHWLQMLNRGYRIFGTANSDNHTVGHASGSMFNYVHVPHDKPEEIDPEEVARQVKAGHVVISDGPFMEVRVNGALPGEEIKAADGKIKVQVKVLTANWAPVNTVQILVNGKADSSLIFNQKNNPAMFRNTPTVFEGTLPLDLKTDAHIIVMAYGLGENVGLVTGGKMKTALPIAVSNPVFVDVDGHGFSPNHDLLGMPLPTALKKKAKDSEVE
ncbi:CehA/McbA family metallohydrolase [Salmonirosea aquatica]|uniref:CehA/McbA family metallohydrolase n=1 Tax=Salmonirosea aquatica TaxID=2654236 RepID=UPI003571403B